MEDAILRRFEAMANLPAPAGAEGPLRDWLQQMLEGMGARVTIDPVGNLLARKGDGGQLVLLGLDEPTFIATGGGPGGCGAAAAGTALSPQALNGRLVRVGEREAILRARKDDLTLDPLSGPLEPGVAAVFAAPRRVEGESLLGPDAGRRALWACVLEASASLADVTVIGLSRAGFSPQGGAALLAAERRPRGVALEVLDEDDGMEIGCGPVLVAEGYAVPPFVDALRRDGAALAVRSDARPLAARLQPAGIEGIGLGLAARYRGGDQERIAYQDAKAAGHLLWEALASS